MNRTGHMRVHQNSRIEQNSDINDARGLGVKGSNMNENMN